MLEIEMKVKVTSLGPVRRRLLEQSAVFLDKVKEHDIYYNAPHRDFAKTDEALRIRYKNSNKRDAVFTYKGPKQPNLELKAREELNISINSGDVFELILQRLGFRSVAEVDKLRENYRYQGAMVSLDSVENLGTFVEIELSSDNEMENAIERINWIAKELGIKEEPILASYLELLLAKQ